MRCRTAQTLISRKLDGRLNERLTAALEGHLGCCEACRTVNVQFAAIGHDLRCSTPADPRSAFTARIMTALGSAKPAEHRRMRSVALTSSLPWNWRELFRPAYLSLGVVAFCFGVMVMLVGNGQVRANDSGAEADATLWLSGNEAVLATSSLEDRLLPLLSTQEK